MLDYIDIFKKSIERKKNHSHYDSVTKEAEFNKAMYTGEGQKEILLSYRKNELKEQKDQRERITISRTKHICRKIENIYDELKILDRAAVNITKDEDGKLDKKIYELNIENLSFELVKYYNLIDSNAFVVFGVNDYQDIEFKVITSNMVYDYYINSGQLKFLIIKIEEGSGSKKVTNYRMYHETGVIDFKEGKSNEIETIKADDKLFTVEKYDHGVIYAFQLGWKKNPSTEFKTCSSLIEGASELFKSLIWEGSELDVTKACHGIVKTFAFASTCTNVVEVEGARIECNDGKIGLTDCPKCKGSGLNIHTSNQDIVYFPLPHQGQEITVSLDKMIHTEHVSPEILNLRQKDIKELEAEIVKTCFNSNFTSKSDVAKTATENLIDLKGMYSALGNLGKQVSECFIWMASCIANSLGMKDVQISHGYALNLKLEDMDALIDQRNRAVDAGVPMEVIKVIDFAIMKKQHVDNPTYLNEFSIWEQFRPLSDKSQEERTSLITAMEESHPTRVLYTYFPQIKKQILSESNTDKEGNNNFYKLDYSKQKELIDKTVNDLIEKLPNQQINRIEFNAN